MTPLRCVHESFGAWAERTPEAVALMVETPEGGHTLTYGELDDRAERLAHSLGEIEDPRLVAIHLDRSAEAIAAILATFKRGAAYVPLPRRDPKARTKRILDHCGARVMVTTREAAHGLSEETARLVFVDDLPEVVGAPRLTTPVSLDDRAFVLYTSGSTGVPKGVEGLHRNIADRMAAEPHPFTANDITCHWGSLGFIDSMWEIFAPLTRGLPLVLISDALLADPRALLKRLAARRVTRVISSPSLMRALLDSEPEFPSLLSALEQWSSSGEPLPIPLARRFLASLPRARLVNLYGLTEACDLTWHDCSPYDDGRYAPIGRALARVGITLEDEHGAVVPDGQPGELCVEGPVVARGYWRDPKLTARRFGSEARRLFHSGDIVRRGPDGVYEYVGRRDHQVKIRGIRVELGEIEDALARHPEISQVVVTSYETRPTIRALAAYFVAKSQPPPTADALRAHLCARLPEVMVPSSFTALAALPLTASKKVDRAALPPPSPPARARSPEHQSRDHAPRLAELWCDVLRIEHVDDGDDFLSSGGDSLAAMILIARVQRELGKDVTPNDLRSASSFADFRARVKACPKRTEVFDPSSFSPELALLPEEDKVIDEALGAEREDLEDVYPLTDAQLFVSPFIHTCFWHRPMERTDTAYDAQTLCLTLEGPLEAHLLRSACQWLFDHHTNLRSTLFTGQVWRGLQLVWRPSPLPWSELEAPELKGAITGGHASAALIERFTCLANRDLASGFDPRAHLWARASLYRLSPREHVLVLALHHIAVDGFSAGPMLDELARAYRALSQGHEPEAPKTVGYRRYARWARQRRWFAPPTSEAPLQTGVQATAPLSLMPSSRRHRIVRYDGGEGRRLAASYCRKSGLPSGVDPRADAGYHELSMGHVEALRRLAREHKLTLAPVMFGCWALVWLARQRDAFFCVLDHGRSLELPEAMTMPGCMFRTLPLQVPKPRLEDKFVAWVARLWTKRTTMHEYYRDHAAPPELVEVYDDPRTLLFNYLIEPSPIDVDGLKIGTFSTFSAVYGLSLLTHACHFESAASHFVWSNFPRGDDLVFHCFLDVVERLAAHGEARVGELLERDRR